MLPEDSMTVLIETLWNVNRVPTVPYLAKGAGINRNIVECKCTYQLFHSPDLM